MAAKIRKGDRVQVLAGKDKGRQGEVIRVMPEAGRALVQGINLVKRHEKPQGMGRPGGAEAVLLGACRWLIPSVGRADGRFP